MEEIGGNSNFEKGAFESWLKEVFQTRLLTVKKGGDKDINVIRMVYGGIVDNNKYGGGVGGYMSSEQSPSFQVRVDLSVKNFFCLFSFQCKISITNVGV